jgi:hypothetical protein|nr:MAG TPA: Tetratricopeptide repeat [Caudoviricetes sp.]
MLGATIFILLTIWLIFFLGRRASQFQDKIEEYNQQKQVIHKVTADDRPTVYKKRPLPSDVMASRIEKELRINPNLAQDQDVQIRACFKARDRFIQTNNITEYASFWDGILGSGGLKFLGRFWQYEPIKIYIEANRNDDAWRLLNQYALLTPNDPTIYQYRVDILLKEGRYQAAIEHLLHKFGYKAESDEINEKIFRRYAAPICKKAASEIKTAKIFEILEQSITEGVYNQDKAHDLLKKYYMDIGIIKTTKKVKS